MSKPQSDEPMTEPMNALVQASAIMSNETFILNLDHDHYIYNSEAMKEGICYMWTAYSFLKSLKEAIILVAMLIIILS